MKTLLKAKIFTLLTVCVLLLNSFSGVIFAAETDAIVSEITTNVSETDEISTETTANVIETDESVSETTANVIETDEILTETTAEFIETDENSLETTAEIIETDENSPETGTTVVETDESVSEITTNVGENNAFIEAMLDGTQPLSETLGLLKEYKTQVLDNLYTVEDMNGDGITNIVDYAFYRRTIMTATYKLEKPVHGIDVSRWQGEINWQTVSQNVDFAIIRAGYGKDRENDQVDPMFYQNMSESTFYDVPQGVYWYSYADTPADAIAEAEYCYDTIKDWDLEYPVFFDLEEKKHNNMDSETLMYIIDAFISTMEEKGYACGLYSFKTFLEKKIWHPLPYNVWVAHFTEDALKDSFTMWDVPVQTDYQHSYTMWQWTSKGEVPGINGAVDLNLCYFNYPLYMKINHLNGY